MFVACSGDPPTTPLADASAPKVAIDTQAMTMSRIAHGYLKQLRDGAAGKGLSDSARQERIAHVQQMLNAADSAISASKRGVAPAMASGYDGSVPTESSPTTNDGVFVSAGTFTDLCLSCGNATGFVQTSLLGILTSSTSASIQSGGRSYSPSSGTMTCVGAFCSSSINLSAIVDCRVAKASGTATSNGAYLYRLYIANVSLFSINTYDDDECGPVPALNVSLGASSISVGTSTQAVTTCVGFVQWSSNAPAVASVSNTGVVTGISSGSAEISATCGANRGSATIQVTYANDQVDQCDDPMTPMVETCDDASSQSVSAYSVTYTRPGYSGEADDSWFTQPEYTETYTVVCDVTDWYEWNLEHTAAHYVDTVVNSCWLQPYDGNNH